MRISYELWKRTLLLQREFEKRGERLSRNKLQEAFQISEQTARGLLFALDNKDIISLKPQEISLTGGAVELVISDLHIPFHHKAAVELVLDFAEREKVNIISILGDLVDFYKISKFIKKNVRAKRVNDELKEAKQFLTELRQRFPNARIIFKPGNHEDRLEKYIVEKASEIADLIEGLLPNKLGFAELNIELKDRFYRIGKLWHLHGDEKPAGGNPKYVVKVLFQYILRNFIFGHYHFWQTDTFKSIDGKYYWGGCIGHLSDVTKVEYMQGRLNKWVMGFAIVKYNSDGWFMPRVYKIIDGRIV